MRLWPPAKRQRGPDDACHAITPKRAAFCGAWALATALAFCPSGLLADTYRWEDDKGVVHFTDRIPPEAAKLSREKLNKEATKVVDAVEAQKTPEQLEQLKRLRQLRIDQQRILAEQRDSDTSLNRTYRSEEEMQMALQNKLNTMNSAKKIADANRLHQEEIMRSLVKKAADAEAAGQPVPQILREGIDSTRKQISLFQEKIRTLENTKAEFVAAFAKDLERFKSLEALQRNPEFGSLEWHPQSPRSDVLVVSAVACQAQQCDLVWKLAKSYIKSKTSRPIVTETPTIMQTAGPREERDMALLVVRIAGKTQDTVFLDTSCHISSIGEELCAGEIARDIRSGFVPYIEAGLKAAESTASGIPVAPPPRPAPAGSTPQQ